MRRLSKRLIAVATITTMGVAGCLFRPDSTNVVLVERNANPPKPNGVLVRTATSDNPAQDAVDVKFMLRGYCFAGSKIKDTKAPGGFAESENVPIAIPEDLPVRGGAVSLHVALDEPAKFDNHAGLALYLVNRTAKRAGFDASDSCLSIVQEARDDHGVWRAIEYRPSSFCGNSYHSVFLDPGQCWRFTAPRYGGTMRTSLRFAMRHEKDKVIYSEEFEGAINPEQFTQKQGHHPTDIMDPYLD